MIDSQATIQDFLTAAAAKKPTPGGGAVAALAGALAASMGEMVLAYSVAKKDLLQFSEQNQSVLEVFFVVRTRLMELMVEDQQAYQAFADAKKASAPAATLAPLVERCIIVPLTIGQAGIVMLEMANHVVATSNRWLISDLAVCGELAMATVRCAVHNVRVNLSEVGVEDREDYESRCQLLNRRGVELIQKLFTKMDRIGNG